MQDLTLQEGQLHFPRNQERRQWDGVQAGISGASGGLRAVLTESICLRQDATENSVLQGHTTPKDPEWMSLYRKHKAVIPQALGKLQRR